MAALTSCSISTWLITMLCPAWYRKDIGCDNSSAMALRSWNSSTASLHSTISVFATSWTTSPISFTPSSTLSFVPCWMSSTAISRVWIMDRPSSKQLSAAGNSSWNAPSMMPFMSCWKSWMLGRWNSTLSEISATSIFIYPINTWSKVSPILNPAV